MTQKNPHHSHTFILNIFGAAGYVATLLVWLLVLECIVVLLGFTKTVNDASVSVATLTGTGDTSPVAAAVQSSMLLQFLLIILLAVLTWISCYYVAKGSSRLLRRFLMLYGRKETLAAIMRVKMLLLAVGLLGIAILVQFIPAQYAAITFAISFLGLVGGIVACLAIWVQKILAQRYRVAIARVL